MGCSPSKGQLFSKKAILSASPENKKAELLSDGAPLLIKAEISTATEGLTATEVQENETYMQGKRSSVVDVICNAIVTVKEDATEQMLDVVRSQDGQSAQEGLLENQREGTEEIRAKVNQGKRRKQRKHRLRKNSYAQSKAEFILKSHQAAYAYLNPSISKYESLLGLLSQAAQTHLSVQNTVASVVLHYEEINQALEEMATEGEQLLREHGHNMTWPASLKDYPPTTTKPSNELNFSQLPSELLQQMLLHSTAKMISVRDSVKCLSDSALQELAEYYGSLSQILGEKLLAKHAAEERLKQVLSRVESAALRKPSPEDSALHSEDSGIGADNECQNGSERLRQNRGSSGSGANTGIASVLTTSCSPDQPFLNTNEEVTDNDDDEDYDDEEEDAELENEVSGRLTDKMRGTMCGSSKPDSTHPPVQVSFKKQEQVKTRKTSRPKTADNTFQVKLKYRHLRGPKRSQSAECLCSKAEGSDPNQHQGNPRNKQTPHCRRKNNLPEEIVHGSHVWTKIRRSSSGGQCAARYYGLQYGSKGPFRAMPPSSPPKFTPEPPGRNAVKRLINTFSQGVEDNSRQSPLDQKLIRVRGNKKCTLPLLQNSRGALTTSGNIKSNIHPLEPRPEQLDIDSLPPPPPEMLIDNSFESSLGLPTEEGTHNVQCRGQRLCTSMQRETVLSNWASRQRGSMSFSTTQPVRQDALPGSCIEQEYKKAIEGDSERDTAHTLDQNYQKAVHLPAESSAKPAPGNAGLCGSTSYQECENHNEGETASMQAKYVPPKTPPVSRARLPPSCPTVHHTVPSPPSTTCPPSGKWTPSATTSATSSIHRCVMAEENSLPASGSQSFFEARSMFCQENKSLPHTWTRSCTSTLPRPWGEPARGRLPTTRLQPSFIGHNPSGQRSSHSEQPQSLPNTKKQQGQDNDVMPLTCEGAITVSMRADGSGTDSEPSTADLNTHSGFVGEEITD